jgi:isopentenyl-diphosphate Delta-isomerase
MNTQEVILVSEKDEVLGSMEKMQAHKTGVLHRAFSVFIFNKKGQMLLQQRASGKYHGGGLWSNTCCSHPYPNEEIVEAAQRRLKEEMGFSTLLKKVFEFVYKAEVENGLTEHEYDHVFAGVYEGPVLINKSEVADYCYEEMEQIKWAINEKPEKFTIWFRLAFPTIETWWQQEYGKLAAQKFNA